MIVNNNKVLYIHIKYVIMYVTYRTNSGGVKKWDNVLSEYYI